MAKIRDALVDLNPWWKGEFSLEYRDREAYREVEKFIALPQIIAFTDLSSGRHLLLLDEIQKLAGWEDQLKALYDRLRKTLKVIISGSESLFIRKGSRETLAGRLFEFTILPLSFREYLNFREVKFEPLELHEKELSRHFDEFLLTEGFPELVGFKDKTVLRKYLRER